MTIIIDEDIVMGIVLIALGYLIIGPIVTTIVFYCSEASQYLSKNWNDKYYDYL
jgi:hypothetical protein